MWIGKACPPSLTNPVQIYILSLEMAVTQQNRLFDYLSSLEESVMLIKGRRRHRGLSSLAPCPKPAVLVQTEYYCSGIES